MTTTPPIGAAPGRPQLVAAHDALICYLDGLLAPESSPTAPVSALGTAAPAAAQPLPSGAVTLNPVPMLGATAPGAGAGAVAAVGGPTLGAEDTPGARDSEAAQAADGMLPAPIPEIWPEHAPYWVSDPFQCLLFTLSGLRLAVPTLKLEGVIPAPAAWRKDATDPVWCLGRVMQQGQTIQVLDLARIVVPPGRRYLPVQAQRIIVLDQGRWGIACEGLMQMMTLHPGLVQWRSQAGRRNWLAGTARGIGCAILDVDGLIEDLERRLQS